MNAENEQKFEDEQKNPLTAGQEESAEKETPELGTEAAPETDAETETAETEPKTVALQYDEPSLEKLTETLTKYGIEVPEAQIELLDKFCRLQWEWNQKINLTRHTTYEKFVTRDLIDTLAFSEFLAPNEKVLDVGSGSGVPGILLGILRPDISISLVECVGKKAKVLADIIHELQLPIPVYCALGQDILGNWQFHTLTFRAVASMRKILEWFKPCWPHFDRMLLVKGPKWINERGEARHYSLLKGLALRKLKEYSTPGSDGGKMGIEEVVKLAQSENPTELENGAKSVILQICPEEKLGKGNLCELSSLETSKSRNKFDHSRRRKSRVMEETIEYVDADDFDGLDEDGDQIQIERNQRGKFSHGKRSAFDRSDREERNREERFWNSEKPRGTGSRGSFRGRNDSDREGFGRRSGGFGGRSGGSDSGFGGRSGGFGGRSGGSDSGFSGRSGGFGGRSGGPDSGFGKGKRLGGPGRKGPRNSGGNRRSFRDGE